MAKKKTRQRRPARKRSTPRLGRVTQPIPAPDGPRGELELADERRRQIAASWVRFHEEQYAGSDWTDYVEAWAGKTPLGTCRVGNPLHVWSAYLECRSAKLALPDWVLDYLDRVASRLRRRVANNGLPPSPKDPAAAIATDLEMARRGAGNVFTHYNRNATKDGPIYLAASINDRLLRGERLTPALDAVCAETGVSKSKLERAWREYKAKLD
jgi:hypothetical protein